MYMTFNQQFQQFKATFLFALMEVSQIQIMFTPTLRGKGTIYLCRFFSTFELTTVFLIIVSVTIKQ